MSVGEFAAATLSFLLTLAVFSYIWRDNPLFRLSLHLFIGVAAGYAGAVALTTVIYPQLITPFFQLGSGVIEILFLAFPPLVLGLLLFTKLSARFSWLGNPTMAFLVGVGAAAAIGGAVLGTLFPQTGAAGSRLDLQGVLVMLGTVATLLYFQFSTRASSDQPTGGNRVLEIVGWGGKLFIMVTFGVVFAGVYAATLTALIERLTFLLGYLASFT